MLKPVASCIGVAYIFFFFAVAITNASLILSEFSLKPTSGQQVELYNDSDTLLVFDVLYIDDKTTGGAKVFNNIEIPSNSCIVLTGDFNFNTTTTDTVNILHGNTLITSYSYSVYPQDLESLAFNGGEYIKTPSSFGLNNKTLESCIYSSVTNSSMSSLSTSSSQLSLLNSSSTIATSSSTFISSVIGSSHSIINSSVSSATSISSFYPSTDTGVILSEIMANPETGSEWVELYNTLDHTAYLNSWKLDDVENSGSSPKLLTLNINAHSFALIETSNMFNNSGDSVRLLNSQSQLIDSMEYSNIDKNFTLSRTNDITDEWCMTYPSKLTTNNTCLTNNSTSSAPSLEQALTKENKNTIKTKSNKENDDEKTAPIIKKVFAALGFTKSSLNNNEDSTGEVLGSLDDENNPSSLLLLIGIIGSIFVTLLEGTKYAVFKKNT